MESLFSFDPSAKGAISFVYKYLFSLQKTSLVFLKSAWENDLGLVITEVLEEGTYIIYMY